MNSLAQRMTPKPVPTGHKRKPSLYWYCRTSAGWRYIPAPQGMKSAAVKQNPNGRMMIRQRTDDGKRVYIPVGSQDASTALQNAQQKAKLKQIQATYQKGNRTLSQQIQAFLDDCENRQAFEAKKKAIETLREFRLACPSVTSAKHITRQHIFDFHTWLRNKGNGDRTVYNKHKRLKVFLHFCNVDIEAVAPKGTSPGYEKTEPVIYTPEEIAALLKHSDDYMRLVIDMGRMLGLREREMIFAEFADIEPGRVFRVKAKPRYGFTTKTYEQRLVPIPLPLYESLMAWQSKAPERSLILGIGSGFKKPNGQLLARLKTVARRAGVQDATLHQLRRNAITAWLRSGMDVKTCSRYAGHGALTSTLRYLKGIDAEQMVSHVDGIKWT